MSINPTCRDSRWASLASSSCSAACGSTPFARRSSPRGPYSTTVDAWVQSDEGHARRYRGARLVGRRIDRAQRERRVLRMAIVVQRNAIGRPLLGGAGWRQQNGDGNGREDRQKTSGHVGLRRHSRMVCRSSLHHFVCCTVNVCPAIVMVPVRFFGGPP
jgi:hypothetical protein